ncbi:MAG: hypothetical protein KAS72_02200 [Phycisphaerales bacterium]|nr:hypothetical protein [Phycisphaerales bacterium]
MSRQIIVAVAALAVSGAITAHAQASRHAYVGVHNARNDLIVQPAPRQANRAMIVTRHHSVAPPFVVSTRIASRASLRTQHHRQPGPAHYGAPDDVKARILVRGTPRPGRHPAQRADAIDAFQRIPSHMPRRFRDAQRIWLKEHGYVERTRIVQRVPTRKAAPDEPVAKASHLIPHATIKMDPALAPQAGGDQRI